MDTIPERLDWLWFFGYDLNDEIPNHSVLSKARSRWGVSVFQSFFERIILQCAEANLIDGTKIFMDSSNIQVDTSSNYAWQKQTSGGEIFHKINHLCTHTVYP